MKHHVYLGTYTEGSLHYPHENQQGSRGIYTACFDSERGCFEHWEMVAEMPNPSFLAKHPEQPILYAVNEVSQAEFQGSFCTLRYDSVTGRLTFINRLDTMGLAPCHITVEPKGRFLVVSNYRSGNFALFPLQPDGIPIASPVLFQGFGIGTNPKRQDSPHAHSAAVDPMNGTLYLVDLGSDTIYVRNFDFRTKTFENAIATSDLNVPSGSGCRHLVFSPDHRFLYVAGELDSCVYVFARNEERFCNKPIQRVSTMESDKETVNTVSAINLHPSGKILCVSNRGQGSFSVFAVDKTTGQIKLLKNQPVQCRIPRFCTFDPTGNYFFVCGQDSGRIQVFQVNQENNEFNFVSQSPLIDSPVCLLF
jgi:6-phosphogluconolactonase